MSPDRLRRLRRLDLLLPLVVLLLFGGLLYFSDAVQAPWPDRAATANASKAATSKAATSKTATSKTATARPASAKPATARPAPVLVEEVRLQDVVQTAEALGVVQANEHAVITSRVEEKIKDVHFQDGQIVQAGQILVTLHDTEEQADIKEAEADYVLQTRLTQRFQPLADTGVISRAEFDRQLAARDAAKARLDAARARLEEHVIRAPFAGVLGLRRVSKGAMLEVGDEIATLDDLSQVKIDFTLPEAFLSRLAPGMPLDASSDAWPGRRFQAAVATVASRLEQGSRAVTLRAIVKNEDGALRPGMLLAIRLESRRAQALVIPEEALAPRQGSQYVFVVEEGGKARRVLVTLGQRLPGLVEVVSGLRAGQRVVSRGADRLTDGGVIQEIAAETAR